jgi:hypothetical protein
MTREKKIREKIGKIGKGIPIMGNAGIIFNFKLNKYRRLRQRLNIPKNKIRGSARLGGINKLGFFPYNDDLLIREEDLHLLSELHSLCIKDGILELKNKVLVTQKELKWFLHNINYFRNNYDKYIDIFKLSFLLDSIPGLSIYIFDTDTVKDFLDFDPTYSNDNLDIYDDNEYGILQMASLSEHTIHNELKEFKKNSYTNISFIEYKIIHSENGWIKFPTFLKIKNLDDTIFFSCIYFKSKNWNNIFLDKCSYNCQCVNCINIIEDAKLELKGILEVNYGQSIDINSTGNFCDNCNRETTASKNVDEFFLCYSCKQTT